MSEVDPANQSAYERGAAAGQIGERLASHDRHFESINGSLNKIAHELHQMTMAVQSLRDQATANAATVVTTAAALKEAEEARRTRSNQSWSPWQKVFAVLAALATVAGMYATLRPR